MRAQIRPKSTNLTISLGLFIFRSLYHNINCGIPDFKVNDDLKNVFVVVVNEFDKFAEWIPLSLSYFLTDYNLRIALNDKNKSQIDFFSTLQMKQFI